MKEGKVGETSSTHDMGKSYKMLTEEPARKGEFHNYKGERRDTLTLCQTECELHAVRR
jgi:hypothetical protein